MVCLAGAGAILSVGLLRSIEWAKMEKRFDVDGGVSGGTVPSQIMSLICFDLWSSHGRPWLAEAWKALLLAAMHVMCNSDKPGSTLCFLSRGNAILLVL